MSECLVVISLLFEADEITKADTQDKNVADSIAVYQSNDRENVVGVLQMRLNGYSLEIEEIAGDDNCFYKAMSRVIYTSDEFYLNVQPQAVEYLRDDRQKFAGFITNDYTSIDNYINLMSRDGN